MASNLYSILPQEPKDVNALSYHRLIQTFEPVPSVKLRGSYQATPQSSGSEGQRNSKCGKVTCSSPSLSTGQL